MAPRGWFKRYRQIQAEFGFDADGDTRSARMLDSVLPDRVSTGKLHDIIGGQTVLVIGAGPSLEAGIETIKWCGAPKIVADSAVSVLIQNDIAPDIVVTDLDGRARDLQKASEHAIMVVHAHADNMDRLSIASGFARCIATTQGAPTDNIYNFGGFTDGDRAVFLADHFGAENIILFGMDFGNVIGQYSYTEDDQRDIKLKKLECGQRLLSWMAGMSGASLFTTSKPIEGFEAIRYDEVDGIVQMTFNPQRCG